MPTFPETDRNRVTRRANRGHYDSETIYAIVDEALICHVGFIHAGEPFVIPTIHARDADSIILHGSKGSRLLPHAESGEPLCIAVTILDGIVFAPSVFDHSMNYRSAVLFGRGRAISSLEEKLRAAEILSEHIAKGRWNDARRPTAKELDATSLVAVDIETASAKIRSGPPLDDEPDDYRLSVWSGVLPLRLEPGAPESDPQMPPGIRIPAYISQYHRPPRQSLQ